jgi:hypothetical protein
MGARLLGPDEEQALQLPDGVPVTRNMRTAYAGDRPVEVMDTISHGEVVSYRFEIDVKTWGRSWWSVKSPLITAALTLSLTGRYERQGSEAAEAVRLWAETAGVRLILVDDQGSKQTALQAYGRWARTTDLLIGPYSSGLVRAVAPLVRDSGRVLWNHGGSADDLAQPGIASLPAPASSYFDGIIDEVANRNIGRLLVVQASGPFARPEPSSPPGTSMRPAGNLRIPRPRRPPLAIWRTPRMTMTLGSWTSRT